LKRNIPPYDTFLFRSAPRPVYRLTLFWRRRVDAFEVLGLDQQIRLESSRTHMHQT